MPPDHSNSYDPERNGNREMLRSKFVPEFTTGNILSLVGAIFVGCRALAALFRELAAEAEARGQWRLAEDRFALAGQWERCRRSTWSRSLRGIATTSAAARDENDF